MDLIDQIADLLHCELESGEICTLDDVDLRAVARAVECTEDAARACVEELLRDEPDPACTCHLLPRFDLDGCLFQGACRHCSARELEVEILFASPEAAR